jgi:pimeloyl-ACP methyl ester carboxylesterase
MHVSRRWVLTATGAAMALASSSAVPAVTARWFPSKRKPPQLREKRLQVGGHSIAVYDGGSGPAVLLLHGNPDSAAGWRNQVGPLLTAGYRVIAPDFLGTGESEIAPGIPPYSRANAVAGTSSIIDQLGVHTLHALVGHDRGAGVAWALSAAYPQRVGRLFVMGVGHPDSLHLNMDIQQRERFWYTLRFQFSDAADALRADNWQLFRDWMRNHPDTDAWIADLARPGVLEAMLNYYRANFNPLAKGKPLGPVAVPTTAIWSTDDPYLGEPQIINSRKFVTGPWRYERVTGAGHFLMLDKPKEVNELLLAALRA